MRQNPRHGRGCRARPLLSRTPQTKRRRGARKGPTEVLLLLVLSDFRGHGIFGGRAITQRHHLDTRERNIHDHTHTHAQTGTYAPVSRTAQAQEEEEEDDDDDAAFPHVSPGFLLSKSRSFFAA